MSSKYNFQTLGNISVSIKYARTFSTEGERGRGGRYVPQNLSYKCFCEYLVSKFLIFKRACRGNQCIDFHEVCFISKPDKCRTKLYVKFLQIFKIWVLFSFEKKFGHFLFFFLFLETITKIKNLDVQFCQKSSKLYLTKIWV